VIGQRLTATALDAKVYSLAPRPTRFSLLPRHMYRVTVATGTFTTRNIPSGHVRITRLAGDSATYTAGWGQTRPNGSCGLNLAHRKTVDAGQSRYPLMLRRVLRSSWKGVIQRWSVQGRGDNLVCSHPPSAARQLCGYIIPSTWEIRIPG